MFLYTVVKKTKQTTVIWQVQRLFDGSTGEAKKTVFQLTRMQQVSNLFSRQEGVGEPPKPDKGQTHHNSRAQSEDKE